MDWKLCRHCNKPLDKPWQKKFCSSVCNARFRSTVSDEIRYCQECGKPIERSVNLSLVAYALKQFCSVICRGKGVSKRLQAKRIVDNKCQQCGGIIQWRKHRSRKSYYALRFCSYACAHRARRSPAKEELLLAIKDVTSLRELAKKLGIDEESAQHRCYRYHLRPPRRFSPSSTETQCVGYLARHGIPVHCMPSRHPFDAVANGWRLEFKSSEHNEHSKSWSFNLHRHTKLDESQTDFYIFQFCGKILGSSFYLLFKAPMGSKVIRISIRSLLAIWAKRSQSIDVLRVPKNNETQQEETTALAMPAV